VFYQDTLKDKEGRHKDVKPIPPETSREKTGIETGKRHKDSTKTPAHGLQDKISGITGDWRKGRTMPRNEKRKRGEKPGRCGNRKARQKKKEKSSPDHRPPTNAVIFTGERRRKINSRTKSMTRQTPVGTEKSKGAHKQALEAGEKKPKCSFAAQESVNRL